MNPNDPDPRRRKTTTSSVYTVSSIASDDFITAYADFSDQNTPTTAQNANAPPVWGMSVVQPITPLTNTGNMTTQIQQPPIRRQSLVPPVQAPLPRFSTASSISSLTSNSREPNSSVPPILRQIASNTHKKTPIPPVRSSNLSIHARSIPDSENIASRGRQPSSNPNRDPNALPFPPRQRSSSLSGDASQPVFRKRSSSLPSVQVPDFVPVPPVPVPVQQTVVPNRTWSFAQKVDDEEIVLPKPLMPVLPQQQRHAMQFVPMGMNSNGPVTAPVPVQGFGVHQQPQIQQQQHIQEQQPLQPIITAPPPPPPEPEEEPEETSPMRRKRLRSSSGKWRSRAKSRQRSKSVSDMYDDDDDNINNFTRSSSFMTAASSRSDFDERGISNSSSFSSAPSTPSIPSATIASYPLPSTSPTQPSLSSDKKSSKNKDNRSQEFPVVFQPSDEAQRQFQTLLKPLPVPASTSRGFLDIRTTNSQRSSPLPSSEAPVSDPFLSPPTNTFTDIVRRASSRVVSGAKVGSAATKGFMGRHKRSQSNISISKSNGMNLEVNNNGMQTPASATSTALGTGMLFGGSMARHRRAVSHGDPSLNTFANGNGNSNMNVTSGSLAGNTGSWLTVPGLTPAFSGTPSYASAGGSIISAYGGGGDTATSNTNTTLPRSVYSIGKDSRISNVRSGSIEYDTNDPRSQLFGKSFGVFSPENRFRVACWRVIHYKWTQPFILVLILLNWVFLSVQYWPGSASDSNSKGNAWADVVLIIIFVFYTVEILVKMVVFGVVKNPRRTRAVVRNHGIAGTVTPSLNTNPAVTVVSPVSTQQHSLPRDIRAKVPSAFLRHSFNRLDLVVVVSFWINCILVNSGAPSITAFAAVAALRPIRLLALTAGLATILQSLKESWKLLADVIMFAGFFFLLFAVIGLETFDGSLSRSCFVNGTDIVALPQKACGADLLSSNKKGYICPEGQVCLSTLNPMYDFMSFDNVFSALLTILVTVSLEGYSPAMYDMMDAEYAVAALYFIFLIVVVSFTILSLFVAVITETFAKIRAEKRSAFVEVESTEADIPVIVEKPETPGVRNTFEALLLPATGLAKIIITGCQKLVAFRYFNVFFVLLTVLQLVALAFESAPIQFVNALGQISIVDRNGWESRALILGWILAITSILFTVEIGLKWIASYGDALENPHSNERWYQRWLGFLKSKRNQLDLLILATDIILHLTPLRSIRGVRYLYGIEVLRIYRVIMFIPRLRRLVAVVIGSMSGIANLLSFILLTLMIVTTSGTQMFGGAFKNVVEADGTAPNLDFDNTGIGFLTVYAIMVSDDWNTTLYNGMQALASSGVFQAATAAIWIGLVFIYAHYVIVSLFIAVILENFNVNDDEKIHKSHAHGNATSADGVAMDLPNSETTRINAVKDGLKKAAANDVEVDDFRTLFLFSPTNPFRRACQILIGSNEADRKTVLHKIFSWFILLAIVASVVTAAIGTPLQRRQNPSDRWLVLSDIVFAAVFTLEFIIAIIANGLIFTPKAYFRDGWNYIDFIVLISMYFSAFADMNDSTGVPRAFRAIRALRPLRIINRFSGMRTITYTLYRGLPRILDAALLMFFFLVPFAIYGLQIFAGYFSLCNDTSAKNILDCVGEYDVTIGTSTYSVPRVWSNPFGFNFDTFGSALLTTFQMATTEGWMAVAQAGMAVTGINEQPESFTEWYNAIYFVAFMFLGSIVGINLFIGIIIYTFELKSGSALLTIEQKKWIHLKRQLNMVKPTKKPTNPGPDKPFQQFCYNLVIDKRNWFGKFIQFITVLNILAMLVQYKGMPRELSFTKNMIIFICLLVYVFEIMAKIIGLGFEKWRSSRWNLYDAVIVLGGLITASILLGRYPDSVFGVRDAVTQLNKLFVLGLAFRLIRQSEALWLLFKTIGTSFPHIVNIFALLLTVYLVYGLLTVEIFGLTRYQVYTNEHINFRSLGSALLSLFVMMTGENWQYIMHALMLEVPECLSDPSFYLNSDCGSTAWALVIFISFITLTYFILLNLFLVVVLDAFSFYYERDLAFSIITRDDLREFKKHWGDYDPTGSGFIKRDMLVPFLVSLRGRFDLRIYPDVSIQKILDSCFTRGSIAPSHRRTGSFASKASTRASRHTRSLSSLSFRRNASPLNNRKELRVNLPALNSLLDTVDPVEVSERRMRFNLIFYDAVTYETSKGLAFQDVLLSLCYQMIDTEICLQDEELEQRLETEHLIKVALATDKVTGFIMTYAFRKRFLETSKTLNRPSLPKLNILEDSDYGY